MTQGDPTSSDGAAAGTAQPVPASGATSGLPSLLPPFPELPHSDEIYDNIMSQIEPELTSSSLPLLPEKYKGETLEEKQTRMARYQKAFEEYDRRSQEFNARLDTQVKSYLRAAMASVEGVSRSVEEGDIVALESQILLAS